MAAIKFWLSEESIFNIIKLLYLKDELKANKCMEFKGNKLQGYLYDPKHKSETRPG